MTVNDRPKIRCYAIIPSDEEFHPLRGAMMEVSKESDVYLFFPKETAASILPIAELVYSEISKSDFVIAETSQPNANIFYEIGLAHAMGKPVIILVQEGVSQIPSDFRNIPYLSYTPTSKGLSEFRNRFGKFLKDFIHAPRRFRPFLPFPAKFAQPPYIIDLEKLDPRDFENLCFELITQMGFRRVEWGEEFREIDVVATLPKKDPDGYEYQELWFISMGRRAPPEIMLEMAVRDPEHFFYKMRSHREGIEKLFSRYKISRDVPITILIILRREGRQLELFDDELRRREQRLKERSYPFTIRVRQWDHTQLTNLIQQYPQIAFKYFSEEGRVKSKYRKTPEELYEENVKLTEEILLIKNQLEEEKKRRFIAERDAAWKDVAFKAAHKLGNPVDAVDNFLLTLKRRIQDKRINEALQIADDMDVSIEEAKTVIAQFKSLAKSQEITPRPVELLPLIQHACRFAEGNGVTVSIQQIDNSPRVMVDSDRMAECFNELVANALHWFDKPEKKITVRIDKIKKEDLPEPLDKTHGYLKVRFEDNGCGVPLENKEKIFAPFYTTYLHGTGLGLSLVKWIIEGHGGRIYENGRPGEGTSFEIYLPIAKGRKRV